MSTTHPSATYASPSRPAPESPCRLMPQSPPKWLQLCTMTVRHQRFHTILQRFRNLDPQAARASVLEGPLAPMTTEGLALLQPAPRYCHLLPEANGSRLPRGLHGRFHPYQAFQDVAVHRPHPANSTIMTRFAPGDFLVDRIWSTGLGVFS